VAIITRSYLDAGYRSMGFVEVRAGRVVSQVMRLKGVGGIAVCS
jgi:hypothetical protein